MENKVLSILLVGLIVVLIFHALALRYEMHPVQGADWAYRIDRLTGRMWSCDMEFGNVQCSGGKYSDTTM